MTVLDNIGYFDDPTQAIPAHNPCPDADCPVCGERNGEAVKYRSVMPMGGQRSYFFAYHSACAGDPKIDQFEQDVMDEVFAWDDAAKEQLEQAMAKLGHPVTVIRELPKGDG